MLRLLLPLRDTVFGQLNECKKSVAESRWCRPVAQLMVWEVVLETGTSSRCQSWQPGPATVERGEGWLLMAKGTGISTLETSVAHALNSPFPAFHKLT